MNSSKLAFKPRMNLLYMMSLRTFYYPDSYHHHLQQEPHVIARRIIKWVGQRLREVDMQRWDGVPITFKTNWKTENDGIDIRTVILVHDALEREFCIDIDDRKMLLNSIEEWFSFVMSEHNAL